MKVTVPLQSEEIKSVLKRVLDWVGGATIGAIISGVLTNNYIWTGIFFVLLVAVLTYYIVFSYKTRSKCDIVSIMTNELKAGNFIQVIRLGYPLSRPLHLAGRNSLIHELGVLIKEACDHLEEDRTIRIDDDNVSIASIKAKILVDDLGWTAYQQNDTDIAIEHILEGIKLAEKISANSISNFTLAIKGYRHLVGIYDSTGDFDKRNEAEGNARQLLNNKKYQESFVDPNEYTHLKAEFDYAYAKTLVDDNPDKALIIAKEVQNVFKSEENSDMDRYVKTFDLIGDIYANYQRPDKLKEAKAMYLKGMNECEKYGRTERLVRISIDYICLLIKMVDNNKVYNENAWGKIDEEELTVYNRALESAARSENKECLSKLKEGHKKYMRRRKGK